MNIKRQVFISAAVAGMMMATSQVQAQCCAKGNTPDKQTQCRSESACTSEKKAACHKAEQSADKVAAKPASSVGTETLAALVRSGARMAIVDARSGKWDDGRRIAGAISLASDASEEVILKTLPDKKALIVTYCGGVTCPASANLAARLEKMGYENVVEYPDGIAGWAEAGLPIEQQNK